MVKDYGSEASNPKVLYLKPPVFISLVSSRVRITKVKLND